MKSRRMFHPRPSYTLQELKQAQGSAHLGPDMHLTARIRQVAATRFVAPNNTVDKLREGLLPPGDGAEDAKPVHVNLVILRDRYEAFAVRV
eukprot:4363247-Pleurochrysis_carterae.AAC.1